MATPQPRRYTHMRASLRSMAIHAPPGPGAIDHYVDDDPASSIASDTSSDIVELGPDEFPRHFRQEVGRLFHSHGSSPYPLPVDGNEQERMRLLHEMLYKLFGRKNYIGPVPEVLSPGSRMRRVVDLGTGTGLWPLDMAEEFRYVRFDGLDIVPIQTRFPPDNVVFEIHDIASCTRFPDGAMDLVHARFIAMAVASYGQIVQEAARLLRRDGLFIAYEWHEYPAMNNRGDPNILAPASFDFFRAVSVARRMQVIWVATDIEEYLRNSRAFRQIESRDIQVPIGDWHPGQADIGRLFAESLKIYAESVRYLLYNTGRTATQVDTLIDNFLVEISQRRGIVCTLRAVWARRV
ncbi:hypothetical protein CERSUDRAFT_85733 [Gelatoporia subvermispora B]|uniref:Uncharacterized protein n=1 Tax=Ceriporiopsis subvermispora (strain B) TaxID=914234 RepID=M2R8G3_CERS8|nr:hypothetical protein CERSUDRAFT_85733 [Gelatoporia subvermispora B]